MTCKFKINNDYLSQAEYFDVLSENKNVYLCEFEINCEENGGVWFAVFKNGDENYITPILDGKCAFPYECLKEPCTVHLGCYAEFGENKRISTNWIPLNVGESAYSQGTAPTPPSADLWETLLSNSVPIIGENGNWYTYDMQAEEYADTGLVAQGAQGPKGDKGDTGTGGYTPQKGVDYFTQADIDEIAQNFEPTASKQDTLVSGENIKTINDESILGNGNLKVSKVWRKVADVTLTLEDEATTIIFENDIDGNPFILERAKIFIFSPTDSSSTGVGGYINIKSSFVNNYRNNYGNITFKSSAQACISTLEVITNDDLPTYVEINTDNWASVAKKTNIQINWGASLITHKQIQGIKMFLNQPSSLPQNFIEGTRIVILGVDK